MFTARRLTIVLVLLAGAGVPAVAQTPRSRIYSHPAIPAADTLRRLDLNFAWSTAVPMVGRSDGFAFVLVDGKDLLCLSRSGQVARVDAERGTVLWKSRPGRAYTAVPYLSANG